MAGLFDDVLGQSGSTGGLFDDVLSTQPPPEQESGIMGTLAGGAKQTARAAGAFFDLAQGDTPELQAAAAAQQARVKDPRLQAFEADLQARKQRLGEDPSWADTILEVGRAAWENPSGAGLMTLEQLPNSAAVLGGGAAGALAGSLLGPAGSAVGAVAGGVAGMFGGNLAIEGGSRALEHVGRTGDMSPEDRGRLLTESAVKAGVITGIDALTLGASKWVTGTAARAAEVAALRVAERNGVAATEIAARRAVDPVFDAAITEAQKLAINGANTLGQRALQTGAALTLETIGEGAGEYLGEFAATGEADKMDAVIESFSSLGQSAAEVAVAKAWNKRGLLNITEAPDVDSAIAAAEQAVTGATGAIDEFKTGEMGPTGLLGAPSAAPTLIAGPAGVGTPDQMAALGAQQEQARLAGMTAPADAGPTGLINSVPIVGQPTVTPDTSGGRTDTTGVRADDLLIPDTAQPATEPLVVPQARVPSDIEAYQAAEQKQARGELLTTYERAILDAGPVATPNRIVPVTASTAEQGTAQRKLEREGSAPVPLPQQQLAQQEALPLGKIPTMVGGVNEAQLDNDQLTAIITNPATHANTRRAAQAVLGARMSQPRGQAQPAPAQGAQNGLRQGQETTEAVTEIFGPDAQLRTASEAPQPGERVSTTMRAVLTQLGRLTGTKVVFVSSDRADGATRAKDGNTVYINVRSSINPLQVLGHETTHVLKRKHREAWAAIKDAVTDGINDDALVEFARNYWGATETGQARLAAMDAAASKGDWLAQRPADAGVASAEATVRDFLLDEMVSDLGGEQWSDPAFWENVFAKIEARHGAEKAKGIIQRLVAAVKEMINKFLVLAKRDGFAEFRTEGELSKRVTPEQLQAIRSAIEDAYADFISAERTNEPAGYVPGAVAPVTAQGADEDIAELEAAQMTPPRISDEAKKVWEERGEAAADRQYDLGLKKGPRTKKSTAGLSGDEKLRVARDAAKYGFSVEEVEREVRSIKTNYPASEGWAQPVFNQIAEKGDNLNSRIEFKEIPYSFHLPPNWTSDKAPNPHGKDAAPWVQEMANRVTREIVDLSNRAAGGDTVAKTIIDHMTWYREMARRLRDEFGGFGDAFADLLGATSPNTPVRTNWNFSVDALRRFVRGEFDDKLKAYEDAIAQGIGPKAFREQFGDQLLTQISGSQYGINSVNAAKALVGMWRAVKKGDAPKARNFALNLIGQSDKATIDVWAARMLQRIAKRDRVPPKAEGAVTGNHAAKIENVTGQFGFGQLVFDKAVKQLQQQGVNITAPDLQAVAWFLEKELWTKNGWTRGLGSEGSFEQEADKMPVDRYQAGATIQQTSAPSDEEMAQARRDMSDPLRGDTDVLAYRALPTVGMYAGAQERSFDQEIIANRGWNPSRWIASVTQVAKDNNQYDTFFSRVLRPDEDHPNARPGLEVYFKSQMDMQRIMPLLQRITSQGIDGFTLVVDPLQRRQLETGNEAQTFVGVRLQYVPEIALRRMDKGSEDYRKLTSGDEAQVQEVVADMGAKIDAAVADLEDQEGVAFVKRYAYDTLVIGKENYDAYTDPDAGELNRPFAEDAPQQPLAERLQTAADRMEGKPLGVGQRDVLQRAPARRSRPDATGDRPAGDSVASESLPRYGEPVDRHAVSVTGVHYSKQQRAELSSAFFGTGLKGQERLRISYADDPRIKRRLYFYTSTGRGISPESGVGSHAHSVELGNVYDMDVDPLKLYVHPAEGQPYRSIDERMNDFESAVLDAGYHGYMTRDFGKGGAVVLLGDHSVPVQYEGEGARPETPAAPAPRYSDLQQAKQRIASNRSLPSGQMTGLEWKRALLREMPDLVPRWLEDDRLYYKSDLMAGVAQLSESRAPTPWYYSELARAVDNAPAKAFTTGKQFAVWVQSNASKLGVKKQEIEATGLTDWLQTQGKITREQVQEYLRQGGVQLTETVLGDGEPTWFVRDRGRVVARGFATEEEAQDWAETYGGDDVAQNDERSGTAKFAEHQLPGGENYKEWLLTLPGNPAARQEALFYDIVDRNGQTVESGIHKDNVANVISELPGSSAVPASDGAEIADEGSFRSSHFDQPNIVAHVRTNERTDADGKRVLFIEEIQSDWAQKGRKEGFRGTGAAEADAIVLRMRDGTATPQDTARINELQQTGRLVSKGDVPSAPFVTDTKSWTALALKRMIAHAREQGFDAIAWTTGDQQADRYDLSKQVDELVVYDDNTLVARKGGANVIERAFKDESELADIIGKDAAAKILALTPDMNNQRVLRGQDLKVGGEGMKGFYDAIVPQVANDVLKKLGGGRVGTVAITNGDARVSQIDDGEWINSETGYVYRSEAEAFAATNNTQPGFEITPAMRAAEIPLFSQSRAGLTPEQQSVYDDGVRRVRSAYKKYNVRSEAWMALDNGRARSAIEKIFDGIEVRLIAAGVSSTRDAKGNKLVEDVLAGIDADARAAEIPLFSEKRVVDTKSPAFRKWFGDSKVVDADGRPLRVYHGTDADFSVFRNKSSSGNKAGFFFTISPEYAAEGNHSARGPRHIMPVYLSIRNPKIVTSSETFNVSRAYVNRLIAAGYDGMISQSTGPGGVKYNFEYVAFRPTQIKSAISNTGEFSDTNGDITASTPRHQIPQMWQDNSKLDAWDNLTRKLQDKLIDTKRIVAAIREAGIAIKDKFDPYLQETLYHGRAAKLVSDFTEKELRPLYVAMQAAGVDQKELDDYLWARHATERNAQIARVNPNMPDGGSGLTNQQAADVLAGRAVTVGTGASQRTIQLRPARMASYARLATMVDAITKRTTDLLVSSGLESQETINKWRATYSNYVPLMRDMESDDNYLGAMNLGMGTGQGFNVRGSASKRAQGSERDVVDILANVAMQRERAITRAEKNRVSTAVYGLALTAPNPDFWLPINPDSNNPALQQKVEDELVNMGLSRTDAAAIAKEPTQTYIDRNGMVSQRINPALRGRDNVLALRVNGQDRYVFFSSDERAQHMVRNLKNLDNDQMGMMMSQVAKVTRYFSSINTQFNPVFGLSNGIRDLGTGMLNLSSTPLKGQRKRVAKYAWDALKGIYSDLRDHRAGRQPTSRWALEFEEFQREGGQTGYRDMFATSEDRAKAIADEIKAAADGRKWTSFDEKKSPIFGWLSDYNTSIENAIRLAAYKVAKENGMSAQQAASLAKNLTVNFNKKGLSATQMGALYAFFNAAVQGTARIGATMVTRDSATGKVSLTDAGKRIAYGGVLLGVMQALALAAAGYDDEEPPQFIREKNLIIPRGYRGKYISIPMPLGFHVIPNLGRIPAEWMLNGFRKPGDRLVQLFTVLGDAFNPIGSSTPLQMLTPTVVDPLAALAENKNWSGRAIYKEDFNKMEPTAGWTRTKDTASAPAKWLAYGINYVTGGGKYGIGIASPTPDQLDYLAGQATGGVGRELLKTTETARSALTGESMPLYKTPVVGRFIGTTSGQESEVSKFYNNLKRIGEHDSALKEIRRAKDSRAYTEYMRDHPDAAKVKLADKAARDLSLLKKQKREAVEKGDRDRVQLIERQITSRVGYYNKLLAERR